MRTATRLTRFLLSTLLLLAIVPVSAPAWSSTGDGTWTWVNPAPTGATLNQLHFVDANTGWVVGSWGTILKTTDAGVTWTSQDSGVFNNIKDVDFVDANTGWAVTDDAITAEPTIVLRTTDGGATWTPADPNVTSGIDLNGVDFATATKGWAVGQGGAIQATVDGGVNWSPQTSGVTSWLTDVKFSSETTGIAVGYQGAMLQTSDGGANWTIYDSSSAPWGASANMYEIRAFDDDNWHVATNRGTFASSDGGATWQGLNLGGSASGGMYFYDADHGWVVSSTLVKYTADGIQSWDNVSTGLPSAASLTDVWFTSATHGIAVGRYGALLTTDDGGISWNSAWGTPMENSITSSSEDVNDIDYLGASNYVAVSYGGIVWRSTDGGLTWSQDVLADEPDLQNADFASNTLGWAVGDYGYGGAGAAVLKTTDAGVTWVPQTLPQATDYYLEGVAAADSLNAWAVGQVEDAGGIVIHTSDGSNWTSQTVDPGNEIPDLEKVFAIDSDTAFICGDSGFIARTSNAGASWETTQTGSGVLRGLYFTGEDTGWAVGTDGEIWSTTNGGDSWIQSDISYLGLNSTSIYFEEVLFYGSSDGVIIGYYANTNIVLMTDDGGATWSLERPGSGNQCDALEYDGQRIWMGGMYGSLLYRGAPIADTIDPVTTAVVNPTAWTNTDVNVQLSASDYQSGVASTLYALGSSAEQPYTGKFAVTSEGVTTISYRSIDASGNAEATKTVDARIDRTPPVTTTSVSHGDGTAVVTLTPTDPLSDVAFTQWTLDGGTLTKSTTVNIAGAGDHTVNYYSTDKAGNIEGTKQLIVTVTDDDEPPATPATISRVFGNDRYATAVAVSKKNFATADTVVLATGADFADALAASGLAGAYDGSLLLTKPTSLPANVKGEIARLKATQVFIIGGTNAVSAEVAAEVDAMTGVSIKRIFGNDRYRTAAAIAREIENKKGAAFANRAFVARGDNYADALAAAPVAYSQGFPILLTKTATLSSATSGVIKELGITDVVIAGGTGAVSADVASALDALAGVNTPVRAQGADRYKTARAVADLALAEKWADYSFAGIATGTQFPDGLAGGAAAGANGGVLLLTKPDTLTPITADAIKDNAKDIAEIQVYGGTGAIGDSVYKAIEALLP